MKSRLPKTLRISELTQLLGISRQAIAEHVKTGVVVRLADNSYTLELVANYCAHLRQLAADAGVELSPQRARYMAAKAEREEMRLAQDQGQLVHVDHVVEEVAASFVTVKQLLRGLPSKLAPLLHACPDAKAVETLLRVQIDQSLVALSATPDEDEEGAA